jgi:hypothetical protein
MAARRSRRERARDFARRPKATSDIKVAPEKEVGAPEKEVGAPEKEVFEEGDGPSAPPMYFVRVEKRLKNAMIEEMRSYDTAAMAMRVGRHFIFECSRQPDVERGEAEVFDGQRTLARGVFAEGFPAWMVGDEN